MRNYFSPVLLAFFCLFAGISTYAQTCDGGTVSTAAGDTIAYTCPGDGVMDKIMFAHVTASNALFRYVVTDDQGFILGLPPGNMVDFEGAGTGNCLVWGLSYTGNVLVSVGDNALTSNLTDDCFDLSDNYVKVVRDVPNGGTVSTYDGLSEVYTCAGDGVADKIMFAHVTTSNALFRYVVTDDQGFILGLPPGNMVDFEGAGPGNCLVWGLSYTGNVLVSVGDNALTSNLTDDCFDLSANYVEVKRNSECVTSFTLVNANLDTDISPLMDGDIIDLKLLTTNKLNIRANTFGNSVESVRFDYNGISGFRTENLSPYALFGDNNGNYAEYTFVPGVYTVTASPFDQNHAGGNMGTPQTITFTVIFSPDSITHFVLVNADTDLDIGVLDDGDIIDLGVVGTNQLSVRAMTYPSKVGSVRFGFSGNPSFQTENQAPYALNGDFGNGDYKPFAFTPGSYMLTATPYSKASAKGMAGVPKTIHFTVTGSVPSALSFNNQSLGVYPNPTTQNLWINLTEVHEGNVEITVLNMVGSRVHHESHRVNTGSWEQQISLEKLPAGMYMINVNNGGISTSTRVVKQ